MYPIKLVKLTGIEEFENKSFLKISIQLDREADYYWQVDHETAHHLASVTDFDSGYFYRMSFKSHRDSLQNVYKSSITQTYRDQSKALEFICSQAYLQELEQIKQVAYIEGLDKLPFLFEQLVPEVPEELPEIEYEKPSEKPAKRKSKKAKPKFSRMLVTAIITIAAIIFTYTGHSLLTTAVATPGKDALEEKESEKDAEALPEEKVEASPETAISEENITIEEDQPVIPSYTLEDTVAYGIPDGMVALTFDDGPSEFSVEIMDTLKEHEAGGTFFFVGTNVKKYPEYVDYIFENGYSVGTHSMTHSNLSTLSHTTLEQELVESSELVEAITGVDVTLFRPPFGSWTDATKDIAEELNQKVVLWNNDPKDWETRDRDSIVRHIKTTDVSGCIIILHETQATIDALPEIIDYLQGKGLELVMLR
ncbi:polysaccharide deacetylase family protein [Ornithinibacillus contaminans]|uniref:polysaccharide deacetylase family protein n=1 Tax=Ornithinibacillus contaminans TaxID=694055 RepID=UPI00069DB1CD|nr:polysaccharide deacetylase family protein [Ornithinibacillus contaminans]